jgi:hypothetical protein
MAPFEEWGGMYVLVVMVATRVWAVGRTRGLG